MNIIKRNNVRPNLVLLYIGVKEGWISAKDFFNVLDPELLIDLTDDQLSLLYDNQESNVCFINILNSFEMFNNQEIEEATKVWELIILLDIKRQEIEINEKLNKISSLWAKFMYPISWRGFINYLPPENAEIKNAHDVYQNFLEYIKTNFEKYKACFF